MSRITSLSLRGALTIAHGQAERELLFAALQEPAPALTLDLSGIDSFDVTGLELLLAASRSLAARGGRLTLDGAADAVTEVLKAHGLDSLLRRDCGR